MAGTIPTAIESLSTTAASNDPTEGSGAAMTLVNDGLRAAYAFVRQTVTAGSDIASASTITPPSTGSSFNLTGTTTVTAIGSTNSWDGRIVWFRHTGAHSFTNSATLVCLGGASITFASGDISAWRQRSSGTWDQLVMSRGGGAFLGDKWSIDSSNRLRNTTASQPHFRATRTTSSQTSGTALIFNNEVTDVGGVYNNSTGVFTAPVAGVYYFSAGAKLAVTTGAGWITDSISLTGSVVGTIAKGSQGFDFDAGGSFAYPTVSAVVTLTASETVSVTVSSLSASHFLGVGDESFFCGALLF